MRTNFLGLSVLYVFLVFFFPFFVFAERSNEKTVTVIVVKQDNLVNICETWLENPHAWNAVAEFNRLENPHMIYPGQRLRIPANLLKGVPMDGTITFLKGRVTSALPGALDRVSLKKGDVINQGSEIETENDSAVEITFEDGGTYYVRIKAIDPEGYEGEFSPAQTFEIEKFPYIKAGAIATWLLGALLIIL